MSASNYPNSSSVVLHVILLCFMSFLQPASALGNETDRLSLLKFKESIPGDPNGVLSSWNGSVHFCHWFGIICGLRHQRVTSLSLESYNLRGTISPHIGNLSFLRFFNLGSNNFSGEIPQQVGNLFRLKNLRLATNALEGEIPVNLSYCSQLRYLNLGKNRLTGTIPLELGSLAKLEVLFLGSNNLTGGIPPLFANISSLKSVVLLKNNLVGTVPDALGRLKNLVEFRVAANNLSGTIPPSLYNISSMEYFYVAVNQFNGSLPHNIGLTLPNLKQFGIAENQFFGIIPESFCNASQLQVLDIGPNNFVGQVPTSLGNLRELSWLNLNYNGLGSYLANSLDFIASLTNCSKLEVLALNSNKFGGVLPKSVANLSPVLSQFYIGSNKVSGSIPATLEHLVNLTLLGLEHNLFTGVIPDSLGKLQNLEVLYLHSNMLAGKIPSSLGNLTNIFELSLPLNMLEGSIPREIAECKRLQSLDISNNKLSGAIPALPSSLVFMDLSRNSLSGNIPMEVGKLKNINILDLSQNTMTGKIPQAIGDCESLEFLYLQGNSFQGALTSTLAALRGLRHLDVSENNFSGEIPKDLQKLPFLLYLNLSFNDLEGEVPRKGVFENTSAISVAGNNKLCGGVPKLQLPRCPTKKSEEKNTHSLKLRITIICVVVVFLLLSGVTILYCRLKSSTNMSTPALSTIGFLDKVSYKRLYEATNGFSPNMLIGTGSFGSVYKGILDQEESPVAIKVLNLQRNGAAKSFIAECNALRSIRHRNLVKILTCCSSIDYSGNEFKALVFEYMSNGSLEKWLHPETNNSANQLTGLNLTQRLNVAINVASATSYLHNDCDQPIIHCDLKPSNVLLDNGMIAHIGDFGLSRLISSTTGVSESKTSTIGLKGTVGYAAPEYALGGQPSKQGDVYSYGILVLEIITGRRPTDEMFKDDFNLRNFVKTALPERLVQIVDPALLSREVEETPATVEEGRSYNHHHHNNNNNGGRENDIEDGDINFENTNTITAHLQKCLVSVLEIGLACSQKSPNERMSIQDVTGELQHIESAYMAAGLSKKRELPVWK